MVNLNSIHVLQIITHVISENAISETSVISKDQKISFHSVENPFNREKDCYKNKTEMDACIKIFKKDLKYNRTCYTAKLPFTDNTIALPDNYLLTKKRTENLIKRLQKYEKLLKGYNAILYKHIEEGILEDVTNETCY